MNQAPYGKNPDQDLEELVNKIDDIKIYLKNIESIIKPIDYELPKFKLQTNETHITKYELSHLQSFIGLENAINQQLATLPQRERIENYNNEYYCNIK